LPQPLALREDHVKTLLPNHTLQDWQLFIHYPSRKQLPAHVRAFVDFVSNILAGMRI
jgi:DNA-binding transcriptional LysR family regulator